MARFFPFQFCLLRNMRSWSLCHFPVFFCEFYCCTKSKRLSPAASASIFPSTCPLPLPRKEGTRSGDDAETLILGLQPCAVLPSSVLRFLVHHHSEDGRKGDRSRFAWGVRQSPCSQRSGHSRKSTCLPAPISDCTEAHVLQTTVKAYTW